MLLSIQNLTAHVKDKPILKDLSLSIPKGGVHVIMGPNGSGKSTLCSVIMGHPSYSVTKGSLDFDGRDLLSLKTDERARAGIFLSFQYPREIPGVSLAQVVRTSLTARAKADGTKLPVAKELLHDVKKQLSAFGLSDEFLRRSLNENASGGEKKRLEMVQLALLRPRLAILDEIDSGLDIDAMKTIGSGIERAVKEYGTTFLIITHYQRLLQYISPTTVQVMVDGKIVKTGDAELARELERDGYKAYVA
jgi:Fe-S cluster assembly ATP-binding protein